MSLADLTVRVGPFNLPLWLLGLLAGAVLAVILQRTVWRHERPVWSRTNDALSSGLLVAIVVWKLTPVVTRFAEIREMPSRLLYYPGGTVGMVAGAIAAALAVLVTLRRHRASAAGLSHRLLLHMALPVALALAGYAALTLVPASAGATPRVDTWTFLPGYEIGREAAADGQQRPTVIVAWATWCGPCTAQMPEIDRFYREHGERVDVIALNLTATEASVQVVREYMEAGGFSLPVALDTDGSIVSRLETRSTPTTVVFDAEGREQARRVGVVNADWLTRRVLPLGR